MRNTKIGVKPAVLSRVWGLPKKNPARACRLGKKAFLASQPNGIQDVVRAPQEHARRNDVRQPPDAKGFEQFRPGGERVNERGRASHEANRRVDRRGTPLAPQIGDRFPNVALQQIVLAERPSGIRSIRHLRTSARTLPRRPKSFNFPFRPPALARTAGTDVSLCMRTARTRAGAGAGIQGGLKIPWPKGLVGSNPTPPTKRFRTQNRTDTRRSGFEFR